MVVSVVIPAVSIKFLKECITSLERNTTYPDVELIVVNDGSKDFDLVTYLNEFPHKAVQLDQNVGFAAANNAGWRVARGDLLMTLNADTEVRPGWLTALVQALENQNAQMVGPVVLENTGRIQSFGCHWDQSQPNFGWRMQATFNQARLNEVQCIGVRQVDGLSGCCMMMTRESLESVGFFDERYQNSCEDADLCLKYLARGFKIVTTPDSVILHHGGAFRYTIFRERTNAARSHALLQSTWGNYTVIDHKLEKLT